MIYCPRCQSEHHGYETTLCNQRKAALAKVPVTANVEQALPLTKPAKKALPVTAKAVTTNAQRQAAFKRAKLAQGLTALTVWAKPDHHAEIKEFVQSL